MHSFFNRSFLITLFMFGCSIEQSFGQHVTLAFEGEVESFSNVLQGFFQVGQPLRGNYTYDLATPGTPLMNAGTKYDEAVTSLRARFANGYFVEEGGDDDLFTNDGPPTNDVFSVFSTNPDAEPVIGLPLGAFILSLIDTSSTVFTNEDLPSIAPDLASFDFRDGRLIFLDPGNGNKVVQFSITALRTVPEPTGLVLLSLAGGFFACWRKR
ncbi:MAG: PEP-CTERM sorting domain-containing protein [Lacipirellulaceae bacterium]